MGHYKRFSTHSLCPSPTVPNLLPNEDEWTIRVYRGFHSWSYQSIPIHSNGVCRTAYMLYSSHSHCVLTVFWLFFLYTRSFVHVGETGAHVNGPEDSENGAGMCQRLLQSRYSCSYSC